MKTSNSGTKTDNLLLVVAVIAVVISIVSAGITYNYLSSFRNKLTGFATESGWVNLTIEQNVAINFTTEMVNWSNGTVDTGPTFALLDTSNQTAANVTDGSWMGNNRGLILENIGNKNVSIEIKSSSDANALIGGSSPIFRWKVSGNDTSKVCNFSSGGILNNTWLNVNTTGNGEKFCDQFFFEDTRDQLKIDFYAKIPTDSLTGDRGTTITVTFSES